MCYWCSRAVGAEFTSPPNMTPLQSKWIYNKKEELSAIITMFGAYLDLNLRRIKAPPVEIRDAMKKLLQSDH